MGLFRNRHKDFEPVSATRVNVSPVEAPFEVDNTATRYMSVRSDVKLTERSYSISIGIGSFGLVEVPWRGTSREDAEASWLEFLHNPAFADIPQYPQLRLLDCVFNGVHCSVRFRTDWMSAYSISPIR